MSVQFEVRGKYDNTYINLVKLFLEELMDDDEYLKSIHLSFENNKETEKYLVLSAKNYQILDLEE